MVTAFFVIQPYGDHAEGSRKSTTRKIGGRDENKLGFKEKSHLFEFTANRCDFFFAL
jgi:hypothetical protein